MIHCTLKALKRGQGKVQNPPDYERIVKRRKALDHRRIMESSDPSKSLPPLPPTPEEAIKLYRLLLKEGYRSLKLTDKEFYRIKLREEFQVTSRRTSGKVQGIMFEKGHWMLKNRLGGLL